ncbi:DNA damage-inducible protein 1 OS=Cryptococcus neoformans var, neoformans serotype D (strain B-3501A) GN=DDI1 PE=3 SV=1 [Rhizoctonia solani AG-1 IB]|uniref:DNA damage-inducible protein 1 n=1 Tax=Thanatephorus cucumeris (strain AG1-IB / isolate 7/3/14) TaxID=1108050 RepID=A0A0B7FNL7_THACB|nr:DNA damage-inducible protein 1 OS=Cryptococcus neoformans var, neoformans serotype D (strain B-3501A) GN=DDI1 PE=3 SV=1 [Rhizoctonia solani AG-1 IB]
MKLSFATDTGEVYGLEADESMEVENLMALLEAECGIPVNEQSIAHEGRELNDPKATLTSAGVQDGAMLQLRRKAVVAGRNVAHDEEMMRLQILGDPNLMRQLRETQPELADAVQNDPQRFGELLRSHRERQRDAELSQQREVAALNADPYNIEAQKRIEEAIRQQAVLENMEHAMEYSPEFFGRVIMLYIPVEVNGFKVKAFVDSGAQQTIMSPECAEQCGLLRLLDKRFAGIAKGVGTAKILGRVHSAQLKLADLHLPCAFTIMEGRDVDLLFGLDMLKAHQACIDLEKSVLRIQGREVKFLSEHELPDKARHDTSADLEGSKSQTPSASTPAPNTEPASSSSTPAPPQQFPGAGNTLGSAPASNPNPNPGIPRPAPRQQPPPAHSSFPEEHITTLQGFGATREQAIQLLQAAGGNLDVAAALLFQ